MAVSMTSEQAMTHRLWDSILHCERHLRYYHLSHVSYGRVDLLIRLSTLVGLIGAGVTLAISGEWTLTIIVGSVLALIGVVASVANLFGSYSDKALLSRTISEQYSILVGEWKRLYRESGFASVDERAALLEKMQAALDSHSDSWMDRKRNERATEEAYAYIKQEFPHALREDRIE